MIKQLKAKLATRCSRTCAAILVVCAAIIGVVWAVTYERIRFEREDDIAEAVKENSNLALALEEHTRRTLLSVGQTLQLLKFEFEEEGPHMNPHLLGAVAQLDADAYVYIAIVDSSGEIVFGTGNSKGVSVADREYFLHHRDHAGDRLRVGRAEPARVSGRSALQISRRIDRSDESFGGVVVAGISPDYFNAFYGRVDLGPGGLIQLVNLDGSILARRAGIGASTGAVPRDGTLMSHAALHDGGSFLSMGRVDGVRRYMSYRVLRSEGLIVTTGVSREHVLAPSREREFWYLLGSSFATLFVLAFGAGLVVTLLKQKRALEIARAGEALYRVTFEQAAVGIAHNSLDGRFLRANARYCELVGYTEAELLSMTFMDVVHPEDVPHPEAMQRILQKGGIEEEERLVRKDGSVKSCLVAVAVVRDASARPDYFVAMVQDVTESKRAQEQLVHQAHYDALTGLPNRLLLYDRLSQAVTQARRRQKAVGVMFVDLDRFKTVNDSLGHESGDLLLREAATRLAHSVRADDTLARAGGDEFVVVLTELGAAGDAVRVAKKITAAMAAPFFINGQEIFITASVGISLFPGDGTDGETLVKNADAAMLRAKEIGRNNAQFYAAAMNERTVEKLRLEADLRRALERNEFRLHYQPKASIAGDRVVGFEALLRWQSAGNGLIPPGKFIPLLEDSGMIVAVGEWVLRAACAQIRDWQRAGLAAVPVAVNVSAKQFMHHDLYGIVDRALRDHEVDASLLQIEITESDAMLDPGRVTDILGQLKGRGVSVAIDDFGTGYSSLGYLKRFPIDLIKLDRSFVTGLPQDADDASIARAVIAMAHGLRLKVIAEGVETEAQRAFLQENGCDQMQGYLFSRPVPPAECVAYLATPAQAAELALA